MDAVKDECRATERVSVYSRLTDEALGREAEALQRKCAALKWATSAAGVSLYQEFSKRLTQLNLEVEQRRT
jgi:hypothetical protein